MIFSSRRAYRVATCANSSAPSVAAGWPAATTAHLGPTCDVQRDAQNAGLCPSPAKAAVWAGPFDAPWGGQRTSGRRAMQPTLPRAKGLSCVKKIPVWRTVLPPTFSLLPKKPKETHRAPATRKQK